MLRSTFLHINGIGPVREQKIWKSGISTWEQYIENYPRLSDLLRKTHILRDVDDSIEALENRDHSFFEKKLPGCEKWRAYEDCKATACFLDIETTGLFPGQDEITVIGLFDGEKYTSYIKGINLQDFVRDFQMFSTIITFNGAFDKRFIKHYFPESNVSEKLNIDLRPAASRLGFSGGLKTVEERFGIFRTECIRHLRGEDAVKLWYEYENGNDDALDLLIKYNTADVTSMKTIIETAYGRLKEKTFK